MIALWKRRSAAAGIVLAAALLVVAAARAALPHAAATIPAGDDAAVAALGKTLFFDVSLSASGRMACETCHSAAHAYGPPNGLAVQLGGPQLDRQGARAVPSLRYTLNRTPVWFHEQATSLAERLTETEPPAGGFTADGRFDHLRDQAAFPLLAASEMANADPDAVVAKLRSPAYAAAFRAAFGTSDVSFTRVAYALERFELTDPSFHPFTSKYDAVLDGHATLSAQEARGKKLFDDPAGGGCAICHIDVKGANGAHPIFTDYQFEALGVPRNPELVANRNPHYFDLGLCGPLRTDHTNVASYCGLFKTPTLRNVATRRVFFHNGRFHTLRDALRFYVERDIAPQKWYPAGPGGRIAKFDDLPAMYVKNIDTIDAPLTKKPGDRPVWNERDIGDVIAYLKTLTDGYTRTSYDGGVSPVTNRRRTAAP